MDFNERYLNVAQEIYLHAVKEHGTRKLLSRSDLQNIAQMADDAAAVFTERFDLGE